MMEMKSCKVFVVCMLVTCYINIYFFTVSPYNIALVKKKKKEKRIRHAGTVDYSVSFTHTRLKKDLKKRTTSNKKSTTIYHLLGVKGTMSVAFCCWLQPIHGDIGNKSCQ